MQRMSIGFIERQRAGQTKARSEIR
jgi:hypothetical protein